MKTYFYCAIVLLAATGVLAGPFEDTFGTGARNKALGGAAISIAEDFTATFYNPSLLAMCRGSRLSMGYDFAHTGLNSANNDADQLGNYSSLNMGFCLKPLNQVGLGVYSNFSLGPIELNPTTSSPTPTFIMYGGELKTFSMMMGGGYSPFKQVSFGAAMSLATGVDLGTNLKVSLAKEPHIVANFPTKISPVVGVILGVTGIPLPDWRLSLVYRSATYGQIDITTNVNYGQDNPGLLKTVIQGLLSYSPHQIALGSSYLLADKWLFTADATYYFWSKYPGPFLLIQNSPASVFGPGVIIADTVPANFSDVIVPRAGVEYAAWDKLKVRTGYSFRPTPAPASHAQLLDASSHRISLGAGYEFQLYQNIFLIADAFFAVDILQSGRGSAINTGLLIGAEYD